MKAVCFACIVVAGLLGPTGIGHATTIDLTSGTAGSFIGGQSFNGETRGVSAQILGTTDLHLRSMQLSDFNILDPPGGSVGARLYDDGTGTLIAGATVSVASGVGQSITIPISAQLDAGSRYRFSFFVSQAPFGNTASGLIPAGFPYTDSTGLLRITDAWSIASDSFPTIPNAQVPEIMLNVGVPEPNSVALLLCALGALVLCCWSVGSGSSINKTARQPAVSGWTLCGPRAECRFK